MVVEAVWLTITARCNNNCGFCYYNTQNIEMPLNIVKKYLKLIAKIKPKTLIIIGGEPTIHKNFIEILKYCNKLKLNPAIVSNGIKLADKDFCKLIEPYVKTITVSLHGLKKTHNSLTNNSKSFELLIKGLNNMKEINPEKISTNTTISKENVRELDVLIELISKILNRKKISFNMCTSFDKNSAYALDSKEFIEKISPIFLTKMQKGFSFKVITPQPLCLIKSEELKNIYKGGCHIFSGSGLVINVDGNIIPCTHWPQYPMAKLDPDISLEDFLKLWHKLEIFRKEIRRYPHNKCVSCNLFPKCYGGCPILWRSFNPKEVLGD